MRITRVFNLFAVGGLVFLLNSALMSSDWPQFRGTYGSGISPETDINKNWSERPPKMLWKTVMSDGGYSGPAMADGKVFIIDHKGSRDIVRAIDADTGKDIWQFSYEDADKANCGFARSTPALSSGRVYTLSRLGTVHCLDARTGKKIWARNICTDFGGKKPIWDYSMSPLVDGQRVILCPGGPDASVVALDRNTGRTIWTGGIGDAPGYATPLKARINGEDQYVVFTANNLTGLDPGTGAVRWTFEWKTQSGINAAAPIPFSDSVFISSNYGHGCALVRISPDGATPKWKNNEMQAHFSSPVYIDEYIYGASYVYGKDDPGALVCLDPDTGSAKWKQPGFENGPLVGVDGVLLIFEGKTGSLVMVKPNAKRYEELGRFNPLGGEIWTAPIVSNGKLIVRNKDAVACFSLR